MKSGGVDKIRWMSNYVIFYSRGHAVQTVTLYHAIMAVCAQIKTGHREVGENI